VYWLLKAGRPSDEQRKVDEWSVMTLYNDVKHFENQKKEKEVKNQEKAKTRDELQIQIDLRKRMRDEQREAERKAADEQQKRYDAWVQEKQVGAQPTPYIHPIPYTLYPTPYTVHPKPARIGRCCTSASSRRWPKSARRQPLHANKKQTRRSCRRMLA
jgi:hypothetical protein